MKTLNFNHKLISLLVGFLFLFQSCSVYHSKSVSPETAIASEKKLKLRTGTDQFYKFRKLEKSSSGIYGIAKKNSKTAALLSADIEGNYPGNNDVKIIIPENTIEEIRLKNKALSTSLNIAGVTVLLWFLIADRGPGHPLNSSED